MALLVKEKEIVTPGEILSDGMDFVPGNGCYRVGSKIVSKIVGMVNIDRKVIKIIPLGGKYLPKKDDIVIGRIVDITIMGWRVDINCPYTAMMLARDATTKQITRNEDLSKILDIGDYIVAKIKNVTSQNVVDLLMNEPGLKKLEDGLIVKISPVKVPRVIGTKGSMVSMIKKETNCQILVGQNGMVWIKGKDEKLEIIAAKAIKKIERESHVNKLTEKIKEYIEKLKSEKK